MDVVDLLSDRAKEKGLRLRAELKGPIPETIISDPVRLKQSLVNLVGNALKFTSKGAVHIWAAFDRTSSTLVVNVSDTGAGITPDQMGRLFKPFSQADASTTRRHGGTGLGLAITKSLAILMGGNLTAISLPGEGSTFTLKVATGSIDGVRFVSREEGLARSEEMQAQAAKRPTIQGRILLVEDGVDNQRLISFLIRSAGGEVVVTDNGKAGAEAALGSREAGEPFGLILMDMQMPVMDGYDASRLLRERGYTGQIVALTAHAMKGDLEKCLTCGCDHYLTKPISREDLIAAISERIGKPSPVRLPVTQ